MLADINSIWSNKIKKNIFISSKLLVIEEVNHNFKLNKSTCKEAKLSFYKDMDKKKFNLNGFYTKFPIFLQEELKCHEYSTLLKPFWMFQNLNKKQINKIGECLKKEVFHKSKYYLYF